MGLMLLWGHDWGGEAFSEVVKGCVIKVGDPISWLSENVMFSSQLEKPKKLPSLNHQFGKMKIFLH